MTEEKQKDDGSEKVSEVENGLKSKDEKVPVVGVVEERDDGSLTATVNPEVCEPGDELVLGKDVEVARK